MARRLDPSEILHQPRERYPWDLWADGNFWLLTHGVDFSCGVPTFKAAAHAAARARGMRVQTTRIRRDSVGLPDQMKLVFLPMSN